MDQKRSNIGQFYSPEAILVYEGHRNRGQGTIADFYQKIPPSSHRVTSLDAQPMDKAMSDGNKAILISGKKYNCNFGCLLFTRLWLRQFRYQSWLWKETILW